MTEVAVFRSSVSVYPERPPFHPPVAYPELTRFGIVDVDDRNGVYSAVREMLALLGLDREHFGTPKWNPLGRYIRPGDKVVIKPNLVLHEFGSQEHENCLTTHGSVIRAVLDYVFLAAGTEGRIVIADAPLQGADFEEVTRNTGLREIQEFYREKLQCEVNVIDLRQVHAVIDESSSLIKRVERLKGDPRGYCEIDLGQASRLNDLDDSSSRYVVGDYDASVTNTRHRKPHHTYVVSRTLLEADAVICVPKFKTHAKAGVTVCLKNLVGIIGSKDCLPHHRHGKTNQGGDEFPEDYPTRWLMSARIYSLLQGRVPPGVWRPMRRLAWKVLGAGTPIVHNGQQSSFFSSGGWYGNDTIWRTVDDLNRILFFYNTEKGSIQMMPQRTYFAVVDGIISMEGNGPLRGFARTAGVIMGGEDPLAIDVVAATLMGFDWQRVRMLKGIAESRTAPRYSAFAGDEPIIELLSNELAWKSLKGLRENGLNFRAPSGWRDYVELRHAG